MKIIHCADLHLDSRLTGNLDKTRAAERRSEILATFRRMVEYAALNEISAVLIAGDMFDTNSVSQATTSAVSSAILNFPEIDFYYLRGNHDSGSFLGSFREIPQNLHLFGKEWITYTPHEKVTISGIEVDDSNFDTAYQIPSGDENLFNIVVLHGAANDSLLTRGPEEIPLSSFRNKSIDYLALGHYHSFNEGELDARGKWCYSGCLEGRGFDETGECGFVVIDTETRVSTFVPFASRKYFDIRTDISECSNSEEIAKLITSDLQASGANDSSLVKITLVGEISEECETDLLYLQKIFNQYFYFIKIEDETRLRIDYEAYRSDNSLKGEFIRLVEGSEDFSDDDKSEIIKYGLQALRGEEIG